MASIRVPDVVPTPTQDAERLRQAFEGLSLSGFFKKKLTHGCGTDEKGVTWILGHRNAGQRKQIAEAYYQLYNETLMDRITSELSGDYRKVVSLWTYVPAERDARLIKEALENKINDKNLQVIIEVACTSSPHHLAAVRKAYCSLFDCSIEEDIEAAVPLRLKTDGVAKLLVGLVSAFRCDKEIVDSHAADRDSNRLNHSISRNELDNDQVVYILSTRNFYQLRAAFKMYEDKYEKSILQDLKSCGSGCMQRLVKMVFSCITSPERHFAEVIRTSIHGIGTDEDSLTRAIVSRAEVDLRIVKEEYVNMYKCTVEDDIVGDTSGDYKIFLLTLTGDKF